MKFGKLVEPKKSNKGASEENKCCGNCKDSDDLNHTHEHHHTGHCNNKEEYTHKCGHQHHLEVK